mmetsp:Transcript_15546/g.35767  ORF Transcript_15546/g.35767 Transcript_15546/m.35767 type:complete len:409 (+) Transcript_15546:1010-2236(+)
MSFLSGPRTDAASSSSSSDERRRACRSSTASAASQPGTFRPPASAARTTGKRKAKEFPDRTSLPSSIAPMVSAAAGHGEGSPSLDPARRRAATSAPAMDGADSSSTSYTQAASDVRADAQPSPSPPRDVTAGHDDEAAETAAGPTDGRHEFPTSMSLSQRLRTAASARDRPRSRTDASSSRREVCRASSSLSAAVSAFSEEDDEAAAAAFFFLARSLLTCASHSSSSRDVPPLPFLPAAFFFFSAGFLSSPAESGRYSTPRGLPYSATSSSVRASASLSRSPRADARRGGIRPTTRSCANASGLRSSSSPPSSSASYVPPIPPSVERSPHAIPCAARLSGTPCPSDLSCGLPSAGPSAFPGTSEGDEQHRTTKSASASANVPSSSASPSADPEIAEVVSSARRPSSSW